MNELELEKLGNEELVELLSAIEGLNDVLEETEKEIEGGEENETK